jgi:hypothetical protein
MDNKDKAKHLLKQGFHIVPVPVNADGSNNYSLNKKELNIATDAQVDSYWHVDPTRRVAVTHPTIGFIDVDVKNGKNGFEVLRNAGYELPDTYNYETKSGGRHYVVRFPAGSAKWVPVEGVDVQVGNGLAVWYGDVISDEELSGIALAPSWAIKTASQEPQKTATDAWNGEVWYNTLPEGNFSQGVQAVLTRIPEYGHIVHDDMIRLQYALVAEAAKGGIGVPKAMELLKSAYLSGEYDTPEHQKEWNDGLSKLVLEDAQALVEANDEDARIESMAKEMFVRNQAQAMAKRMEAAKYATGVKRYSWEELEALEVDWAIDGFLAFRTNTMLVGAPNLGKTFLYIDWMGSCITGLPWAGRATKKAKFMVVIGEGATGYADRLKAWCHDNGKDYETVKQSIIPMSTASLASDSDIDEMRQVAHAENVDFIIFDTWNTNSGMSDENANAEAAMALNSASRIKPDAGVVIIHHPNAETQNTACLKARGATAVQGKMDFVITMFQTKLEKENDAADAKYITVSSLDKNGGKSRHSERTAITGLWLKDVLNTKVMALDASDMFGRVNSFFASALKDGVKTKDQILAWADDNGWDVSESTFKRWVKQADDRLEIIGTGTQKKTYNWNPMAGLEWDGAKNV